MKSIILFLLVTVPFAVASRQEQHISRFGVIEITDDEQDRSKHRLLLNGKEVFQYEGESIEITDLLKGKGRDYIVVSMNSGGIACPIQFVIVEVYGSGGHKVSQEFGACTEPSKMRFINDRVILEMPSHIPHPDLLSKRELRRRERTKEVFTWYKGKLTKRIVSR